MEQKLMLIVNPAAGRGASKPVLADALQVLDAGGYRTSVFFTAVRGHASDFAAQYGADYDTVACIGGDGTLSEVISGIMRLEKKPKLAYIPMGTANDVASTLNLPKNDPVGAARRILSGTPHPYDVGGLRRQGVFRLHRGLRRLHRRELRHAPGPEEGPRPSGLCAAGHGLPLAARELSHGRRV